MQQFRIRWSAIIASLAMLTATPLMANHESNKVAACDSCEVEEEINHPTAVFPSSTVPEEHVNADNEQYFEGYLQALLDLNYYECGVDVLVKKGTVYLYNLPKNGALAGSIYNYVQTIPGVNCLEIVGCPVIDEDPCHKEDNPCRPKRNSGIWMPQQTILFAPLLADPRQSMYSGAYRYGDRVIGKHAGAVSFGEDFPIYRWRHVGRWGGDLQVGIEGCVFAVFSFEPEETELVNADYFVSIPFTYAVDKWSWRFRIWHLSSHLGDEYMEQNPNAPRYNLSKEVVDVFASYQINQAIRAYAGAGYIIHYDKDFPFTRPYVQYGMEFRFWGRKDPFNSLYRQPFFAFNVQNAAYNHWNFDATAVIGMEWSKMQGVGRKVRVTFEGHSGFSEEGQFCKEKTSYLQAKLAYGF
ncbi:MAG: DUF1207 domain-containing protein [Parachlamydiales bacterium]|nr:DUF1207 domain-containing protein [Parachlamydiales bacterium]